MVQVCLAIAVVQEQSSEGFKIYVWRPFERVMDRKWSVRSPGRSGGRGWMTASGGTAPGAADQAGRPRRDGACASVATHPSSVALAEALPRSRLRRPAARSTCEGLTGERGGPTAPFHKGDTAEMRPSSPDACAARLACAGRRLPRARRRLVGERRRRRGNDQQGRLHSNSSTARSAGEVCTYGETLSGEFKIGSKSVADHNPTILQGGLEADGTSAPAR